MAHRGAERLRGRAAQLLRVRRRSTSTGSTSTSTSTAIAAGRSSSLPDRFQGWDGIAHGGIVCTILDEVMAWSLAATDNWGVTARLSVDFRKPVRARSADPRPKAGSTAIRRRMIETAGRIVDAADGEVLATAEATYVAADAERKRELQARYRFRLVRRDATPSRGPSGTVEPHVTAATLSPITARGERASSPIAGPTPRPSAAASRTSVGDPDGVRARCSRAGLDDLADPDVPRGPATDRAGDRRAPRRPLAADRGRQARLPRGDAARARRRTGCSSPIACSASRELEARWFAFGLLERLVVDDTGAGLAAPPPRARARPATGSRSTASPTRSARGSCNEPYRWAELEQLVYSPSRWERRLVGSTIATMPFVDRRRGRDPEVAATVSA